MRNRSSFTFGLVFLALSLPVVLGAASERDIPIVDAAKDRDLPRLRALLSAGADVNERAGDGATALLWASYKDDLAAARLLIDAGADVNLANDLGATPLWAASRNGSAEMAALLLGAGASPDAPLLLGETPLVTAARTGSAEVVELLLDHGAEVDARGPRGQTPLMFAAAQRHPDVVRVLIAHGADLEMRSHVWNQLMAQSPHAHPEHQSWVLHGGNTALMFAARVGDAESTRLLVDAGADVDAQSAWGSTPLALAVFAELGDWFAVEEETNRSIVWFSADEVLPGEYGEVARTLLEAGADPDGGRERFTPLIAAIMRKNVEGVRLLLDHGADPAIPLGDFTPHQRGSSTDVFFHKSWVGAPPIWFAARFGTPEIVAALLDAGADPNHVHTGVYYGGRPGGILSERQEEVSTVLMAAVELGGNQGSPWTPVPRDEEEVLRTVELLVQAGADPRATATPGGPTPIDGARELGFGAVEQFLATYGAEP